MVRHTLETLPPLTNTRRAYLTAWVNADVLEWLKAQNKYHPSQDQCDPAAGDDDGAYRQP